MALVGACHALGDGEPQDYTEAFQWFLRGAYQEDPVCEASLGLFYEHGLGGAKIDKEKACKLYHCAALQGDPVGQGNFARCCEEGIGVPVDREMALHWYKKAAENGDEPSHEVLKRFGIFSTFKELENATPTRVNSEPEEESSVSPGEHKSSKRTENSSSDQINSESNKRRRFSNSKKNLHDPSFIWKYFERLPNLLEVRCLVEGCDAIVSIRSSKGRPNPPNLKIHLKSKHKIVEESKPDTDQDSDDQASPKGEETPPQPPKKQAVAPSPSPVRRGHSSFWEEIKRNSLTQSMSMAEAAVAIQEIVATNSLSCCGHKFYAKSSLTDHLWRMHYYDSVDVDICSICKMKLLPIHQVSRCKLRPHYRSSASRSLPVSSPSPSSSSSSSSSSSHLMPTTVQLSPFPSVSSVPRRSSRSSTPASASSFISLALSATRSLSCASSSSATPLQSSDHLERKQSSLTPSGLSALTQRELDFLDSLRTSPTRFD